MTTLVLVLSLIFGGSHVYQTPGHVGVMIGCTAGAPYSSGVEVVGTPGYYQNDSPC